MRQTPKLPGSTVAAPYEFQDTPEFWDAVQAHTGELDHASRTMLSEIIEEYVFWAQHSDTAKPVPDALRELEDYRNTAVAFWNKLNSRAAYVDEPEASINLSLGEQTFYERSLLEPDDAMPKHLQPYFERFADDRVRLKPSLNLYVNLMTIFVGACDAAEKELMESSGRDLSGPGRDWDVFVARLADFYESIGRRVSARKETFTKTRGDVFSPFVTFVHVLQRQLPAHFCHHPRGKHTKYVQSELNSAVAKALKVRRNAGLKTPPTPQE